MGWKDKSAARKCLLRILDWDFDKIILSHGDLIEIWTHLCVETVAVHAQVSGGIFKANDARQDHS